MSYSGTLVPLGAQTTNGNTATIPGQASIIGALFIINVTAVSGDSIAMSLKLQCYDPASAQYVDLANFTQITTTGLYKAIVYPNASGAIFQVLPDGYRLQWDIAGTEPSFTFSIGVNYLT